jgi:signal transduction histidine kinase
MNGRRFAGGALLAVSAAALIATALLLWTVSRTISDQLGHELATARVHVQRLQELERAASSAHVLAVERWISDNTRRAEREAEMLGAVDSLRDAVQALGVLEPVDEDERGALTRLMVGTMLMSNQLLQALFSADVVGTSNDLQRSIDTVRAHATAATASLSRAGSSMDHRLAQLRHRQVAIQLVFVLTALTILGLAIGMALRQVRVAEALRRVQAESATQRARFFANMSHELRTPLVAIRGFATMMSGDPEVPARVQNDVRQVDEQAQDLLTIINNILDASKLESGKLQLAIEDIPVAEVVGRCLERCRGLVGDKALLLGSQLGEDLWVRADRVKLQQVLTNLLSNAIRFTAGGFVRVRAERQGAMVVITVEDSGIGIPADALERIWEPFQQADAATDRKYGGTGLGLSIVKGLVDRMGGSVRATSEPGSGAAFLVSLPAANRSAMERAS